MSVRDTLDKIENLVASSMHMPLTGMALINEENLTNLIEELRKALPQELDHAEQIIRNSENIIREAKDKADQFLAQAERKAEHLVDENDVVLKAREKARIIETQAHQKGNEIIENANIQARQFQEGVERYAFQVFDQLIANVTNTCNGVQAAEANLKESLQVLQQSKIALKQQAYANAKNQNYVNSQNQSYNDYQNEQNLQVQNYSQNPDS